MAASSSPLILLVGGGSGGHSAPLVAIAAALRAQAPDAQVHWVGERGGFDDKAAQQAGIPFHVISAGKLRRYFSVQTVVDLGKFWLGMVQAFFLLLRMRPSIIVSKGGYVALPVLLAARALRVPYVAHESDSIVGMVSRITGQHAARIYSSFPQVVGLPAGRTMPVGLPLRPAVHHAAVATPGQRASAVQRVLQGYVGGQPLVVVTGGSQGAAAVNDAMRTIAPQLCADAQVVLVAGAGKALPTPPALQGRYDEIEYADELPMLFAAATVVVSRASSAIFELWYLQRPMVLVPLPGAAQDHQTENARQFAESGRALMVQQGDEFADRLLTAVRGLLSGAVVLPGLAEPYPYADAEGEIARDVLRIVAEGK